MDQFLNVLSSFGVSVAANVFYNFIKSIFAKNPTPSITEFESALQSFLQVHGANVAASSIIEMFAARGLLDIKQSHIYAPQRITMGAGPQAQFHFGFGSSSSTDRTRIDVVGNAQIIGSNAAIVQDADGSIRFLVGK